MQNVSYKDNSDFSNVSKLVDQQVKKGKKSYLHLTLKMFKTSRDHFCTLKS